MTDEPLPALPTLPKTIIFDKKREKQWDKDIKLATRELRRMGKLEPMTPEERKERRRLQQVERRANKALLQVVL
jgi:hypothetical protein